MEISGELFSYRDVDAISAVRFTTAPSVLCIGVDEMSSVQHMNTNLVLKATSRIDREKIFPHQGNCSSFLCRIAGQDILYS